MAAQVWFEWIADQASVTLPYAGWQEGFHYLSIFVITINRCYVLTGKLNMVPDTETRTLPSSYFSLERTAMSLSLIWTLAYQIWLLLSSQVFLTTSQYKTSLAITDYFI